MIADLNGTLCVDLYRDDNSDVAPMSLPWYFADCQRKKWVIIDYTLVLGTKNPHRI